MATPDHTGASPKIEQTEQYVLNYSFDNVYKILMTGLAAYNAASGNYDRVQIDANGGLKVSSSPNSNALRMDDTSTPNVIYLGKSAPGTASGSSAWQIQKIDQTSGTVITWASGDANFTNVWDNRTALTYS